MDAATAFDPEKPLVSVIIPTHNRPELLLRSVSSVLSQTEPRIECVVVNDGGPPISLGLADRRIHVLQYAERVGPGPARNLGVKAARADTICFLDDDDYFAPDRVAVGLSRLGDADISIVNWTTTDGSETGRIDFNGDFRHKIGRGHWPGVSQAMFPKSLCASFSDLRVSEDFEWWLRMAAHAQFAYVHEPLLVLDRHATGRVGVDLDTHYRCRKAVLAMHPEVFDTDRRARAFATARIAAAALAAGLRREALSWGLRSLRVVPTARALRVTLSALRTTEGRSATQPRG